jgi:membrane protease YdiL (CAAX protease family)
MKFIIFYTIAQSFLLLFLLKRDQNDGEKGLFRKQKWGASDAVFIVLGVSFLEFMLYYFASVPSIYQFVYQLILQKNPLIFHTFIFLSLESIFLIMLFKFRIGQNISELGIKKNNLRKNIGLGMTVGFIISLIPVIINLTTGPNTSVNEIFREIRNLSGVPDYILYFFAVVILGPIVEESIYRGMLYSPYRKKYGPIKAVIITSLFFAIVHFEVGFGFVFIYGVVFGSLYERTESLVSPIAAHSLSNLIGTLSAVYLRL